MGKDTRLPDMMAYLERKAIDGSQSIIKAIPPTRLTWLRSGASMSKLQALMVSSYGSDAR